MGFIPVRKTIREEPDFAVISIIVIIIVTSHAEFTTAIINLTLCRSTGRVGRTRPTEKPKKLGPKNRCHKGGKGFAIGGG